FQRVDVHHDLSTATPKGLRDGGSGHVGNLVADRVTPQILELRFIQALTFQRDEANRQAGGVKFQDHRWQRARWETAQVGHGQVGYRAQVGVRVSARLKINFDQAYAR